MSPELAPSTPTASRTRRVACSLIIVIATIPIACSSGTSNEPSAAEISGPTVPTQRTDELAPTVNPAEVASSQALFGTPGKQFEPGTYFVDDFEGTPTARVHVTLGPGWVNDFDGWSIANSNGGYLTFNRPDAVLIDACHPGRGYHPGSMSTLDSLVTALSEQHGWAEVATPASISIDGYAGAAFQRTSPADFSNCPAESATLSAERVMYPQFPSWENTFDDGSRGWSYYGPGTTETLRVLDLDRTIIILSMRASADEPAATHAELAAVLDSIRIGR